MHRKLLFLLVPTVCILLVATSLYLGREHLTRLPNLHIPFFDGSTSGDAEVIPETVASASGSAFTSSAAGSVETTVAEPTRSHDSSHPLATAHPQSITIANGTILPAKRIQPYISAILDPSSTELPRLECPALNTTRYDVLKETRDAPSGHIDYYFALDLRNCLSLLPRLLGSIVEAIQFLGPERCALSIIEGNSPDGTADVLEAQRPFLKQLGISYFFKSSDINPAKGDRIKKLAQLRNLALEPLFDTNDVGSRVSESTTVLFVNDVAACAEDLLELALSRRTLGADMTCAMDWTYVGRDPTFYDVWVARGMNGDSFFEIPPDGNWNSAWNLFWNAPETKARFDARLPFQVFSCWNGAVAFGAAPLLLDDGLRFRHARKGECAQGEPQTFCKDLWSRGYGKIAVVPAVNLEYSDEKAEKIKHLKGYTSDVVRHQAEGALIDWIAEPPEKVKCMPSWNNQFWRPWNESLPV
ncbi:glycosyltransferase family 69 protein [Sodiomyces alcalophilus JCM 7366]|uniref:glycosyltransferase family 69 protein n=1 Tax=Sodiomyces alcalophilus JCM 7366 TaxID=591952 RepID=UPI0039B401AB